MGRIRWVAAALVLAVAGCSPAPAPTPPPSAPAHTTTASSTASPAPTTGAAVDRPTFPDPKVVPRGFAEAPAGDGLTGYLAQRVTWKPCGGTTLCATVLVPLDYSDPSAQAITVAIRKMPATATPKLGTLFLNPGGPGGSGKAMVTFFDRKGLEQYDLIGWDPRGVGDSTPVVCYSDKQTDAFNNLDASPDTPAERKALIEGTTDFAKSCWEHSGRLLAHISTVETAHDLDMLRALVGDEVLHYFGYSYGTQIGATYATLFPANVGRMVLDGAVDITDDQQLIQATGFDRALGDFASWCAKKKCVLGASKKAVRTTVSDLFAHLDTHPLRVGDRELTQTLAVWGVAAILYEGTDGWETLSEAIDEARDGDGELLLMAADQLNGRRRDGHYDSLFYSFTAIRCLDTVDDGLAGADEQWAADRKAAPIFGTYGGPDYACPRWPVPPAKPLHLTAPTAPPILVVGTTGDPATPYAQAKTMATQLGSGVLLTYDGEGHTAYGGNSPCINTAVVAYLTSGKTPAPGKTCH